jgi:hypothetical protein
MSSFSSAFIKHLNTNVVVVDGYVALDSLSNVVGLYPTATAAQALSGPYSYMNGASHTVPVHTSTGLYTFELDNSITATALLSAKVALSDQGANVQVIPSVMANVLGSTSSDLTTLYPGTDPIVAIKTILIRFRHPTTGALTDPQAHSGFWISLTLKQSRVRG